MFNLYVFVYFVTSFLFQEKLWFILVTNDFMPITHSELLDLDYLLVYYPVITYVACWWLPTKAGQLKELCMTSRRCRHFLGSGNRLIVGTDLVDKGDPQWTSFRSAIFILFLFAVASTLLKNKLINKYFNNRVQPSVKVYLNLAIGIVFLFYIHGAGAMFPLFFSLLFHTASHFTAGLETVAPATTWFLAGLTIFAKEPHWPVRKFLKFGFLFGSKFSFLDKGVFAGEYSWHLSMNLVLLRLISYSMDRHWAALHLKKPFLQKKVVVGEEEGKPSEVVVDYLYKGRVEQDLPFESYTLVNCVSHAMYAPLFLAGPTIPFNAYMSYCGHGGERAKRADGYRRLTELIYRTIYAQSLHSCFVENAHFLASLGADIDRLFRKDYGDAAPNVYHQPYLEHVHGKAWLDIILYWFRTFVGFWFLERGSSLVYPFALHRANLLTSASPAMQGAAVWFTLCLMWLKFLVLWR